MKVLFTSIRNASHFLPLVPFIDACRRVGHDVAVAAPPDLAPRVEATGAAFFPFGHPGDQGLRPYWQRMREVPQDEVPRVAIGEIFAGLCAETALPEGPTVFGKFVGTADAFHQGGEDAGGSDETDDEGDDEGVSGPDAVRRVDEVALQERADIRGQNAIEEQRELEAEWGGVGEAADDRGGDDERGEEGHHRGVGSGLGEVETVVPCCAKQGAVQDSRKSQEFSHRICPRVWRRRN